MLSLHPHDDRGCAVAATELGVLAGADRVEGTLFGNGERTGNVDVVTLAMNLFAQGVDPELDVTDIDELRRVAEYCNRLPVHPRHPYVGDLVYTAFSGSHQDAIKKGIEALPRTMPSGRSRICPSTRQHVGRTYEAVIRVNSQSGKGGVGLHHEGRARLRSAAAPADRVLEDHRGDHRGQRTRSAPRRCGRVPHRVPARRARLELRGHDLVSGDGGDGTRITAQLVVDGIPRTVTGAGNGPIAAFVDALRSGLGVEMDVVDYAEHALGQGADATAVAYVETIARDGSLWWGSAPTEHDHGIAAGGALGARASAALTGAPRVTGS